MRRFRKSPICIEKAHSQGKTVTSKSSPPSFSSTARVDGILQGIIDLSPAELREVRGFCDILANLKDECIRLHKDWTKELEQLGWFWKGKDEERRCHNMMCNKSIGRDGYISPDRCLFLCQVCYQLFKAGKLNGEALL